MGFERPEKTEFKIPVSDTQAYRQFGNAVVVPVVRAVAKLMKPHIEDLLGQDARGNNPPHQHEFPFPEMPFSG